MSENRVNDIFAADQAQQLQQTTQQQYEIPAEIAPLPSNGLVYVKSSKLHGRTELDIKAMTAREEDILTSRALAKKGTMISELLKSCIIDKTINVRDLLQGDRNALLVSIRITGYGKDYDVETTCPRCEHKSKNTFDLTELPIKRLALSPVTEGVNEFAFTLPLSGKRVTFKFLTGADEEEITQMQEKRKKQNMQVDNIVTTALQFQLLSIDGHRDGATIASFVRQMPARDSSALRKYIRDNEPGIEMTSQFGCGECDFSGEVSLPLGASFFWPDA